MGVSPMAFRGMGETPMLRSRFRQRVGNQGEVLDRGQRPLAGVVGRDPRGLVDRSEDSRPLDPASSCPAARDWSRAYLHHLVKSGEILGMMLLTWANLAYYQDLMAGLRQAIAANRLDDHLAAVKEGWARGETDED